MVAVSDDVLVLRRHADDNRRNKAVERLARVVLQVKHLTPSQLASEADVERTKSFINGVLAHLIIVPAWVVPPAALVTCLTVLGAPFGIKGVISTLGLGAGLFSGPLKWRPYLSAILAVMAVSTKRLRSAIAAGFSLFMIWLISRKSSIPSSPWLFDFVNRWARDYYKQTCLRGALGDIRPTKSFFGFHPHGCLAGGFTVNSVFNADFIRAAGRVAFLCDGALRHRNPGFGLMAEAYKTESRAIEACDAAGFKEHMSSAVNVGFLPGGFFDAVAFEYRKDVCVLRTRKGFIKYCLQYGYRAHPIYTFGECETYYTFTGLKSLRMWICKKNVPALAFFGWPLLPFLPRPDSRLMTYVGPGIDMPHIDAPSQAEVDHWHVVYMEALTKLFNDNKAEAGFPNSTLKIL
jgi:2-acylglycerol O-acyltransferase 2